MQQPQPWQQPQPQQTGPYGSSLLNDIHNYFPHLLYLPSRFNTVRDVISYVQQQMSTRYDTFSSWRTYYERMDALERAAFPQQQVFQQQQQQQQRRSYNRWQQQQQQQQQQRDARPRVYVPPSPTATNTAAAADIQVTGEIDQTALNTLLNQAFLGNTTDAVTSSLLRSIFGPLDIGANRTVPFWEPVLVAPTAAQIAAASTTYAAPTALDTPCAICQDTIAEGAQVRKLSHCNHFFHRECVDNWFLRDVRCPTCRHDIRARLRTAA